MASDACCICSSLLDTFDEQTEKPIIPDRYLGCCGRVICTRCVVKNPRFKTYCPYCQISSEPSALPQGLKEPPSYDATSKADTLKERKSPLDEDELPSYSEVPPQKPQPEKGADTPAEDVLHFVTPDDSLQSLSLAYGVPINALRKTNNIFADHLLKGRKTVLIPGEYYKGGVSLSPQPLDNPEEELKKSKIRRWMMACKCAEYDVAILYLEQTEYDLEVAIQAFHDDEQWEKEHPMKEKGKKPKTPRSVGMRRFVGGSSRT